ncbi:MAG: arginyltransferase [Chitinivibrionales bacterium]|nr:arginyltransferase [Chitinivibrionales bacterium]
MYKIYWMDGRMDCPAQQDHSVFPGPLLMIIIKDIQLSNIFPCPYIDGRTARFAYFHAFELDERDLEQFLAKGWRKFGAYFFRPMCLQCRSCSPIRVKVQDFRLRKSQRKIIRRNALTSVEFKPLSYSDEIFDIYVDHSIRRFNNHDTDKDDFQNSFFFASCPSLQSEYYYNGKLAAAGFLDCSSHGLSSVYFVFHNDYKKLGLGVFSMCKEIEYARKLGLEHYYLGYYIRENASMAYKNRFCPHQHLDWSTMQWADCRTC